MTRRSVVLLWLVLLGALSSGLPASAAPLDPPTSVRQALLNANLAEIFAVDKLPSEIRDGEFAATGIRTAGKWRLAEPGGAWQETDTIMTPGLPDRRLIFAACDSKFCVLHYELGGYGVSMHLLALERVGTDYKALWHAVGFGSIPNLKALRHLLRSGTQFFNAKADNVY